jgi:hypothetical protein
MKVGVATHQRVRCVCCAAAGKENPYFVVHPKARGKAKCPRCGDRCRITRVQPR